jgi:hypothetical protein
MRNLLRGAAATTIGVLAFAANAVAAGNPLDYSLKEYGFVLLMALFGGAVSWYAKVRAGYLSAGSLIHLVGELTTSAFAGLLAFYVCEWLVLNKLLTAALVAVAGHMGTRAVQAAEGWLMKAAERKFGPIEHRD